ncbi:MAG: hypothetical protein N4A45_00705 [Flavobacteriales bacterium]|jgi:uncharacterized membrane protein|nr:hypothetical protein [Flavobacteriales bacterium]
MEFIKTLHSHFSYLVAMVIFIAFITSTIGLLKKKFGVKDLKLSLIALILTHIQLLFGLILFSPHIMNFGSYMGEKAARLRFVEHPMMMVLVAVFVTIAHSKTKKNPTAGVMKTRTILYGLSVLFIALRVLPFWLA